MLEISLCGILGFHGMQSKTAGILCLYVSPIVVDWFIDYLTALCEVQVILCWNGWD
jgi:hypothetical protein